MTDSLSPHSLYDLLDSLGGPLRAHRDEEICRNRQYAELFSALSFFENNETKQTEIMRSLLDPKGRHGQGTLFLRHFLTNAWPSTGVDDWPEEALLRARIIWEHYIECVVGDGKRPRLIDLWIEVGGVCILAVESKARGAVDQRKQVEDYLAHLKNCHGERKKLLYLKDGDSPSCLSISKASWRDAKLQGIVDARKYPDFIRGWLTGCKDKCGRRESSFLLRI